MSSREELPSLLLLPPPPAPASRASLSAAYQPSLQAALAKTRDEARPATLFIAVVSPVLSGAGPRNKNLSWFHAQSLLAGLYSLIAALCADAGIPCEMGGGPGSVDARIILVDDHEPEAGHGEAENKTQGLVAVGNNTAVVDLATFACAYQPWNLIFYPEGEAAYRVRASFLKCAEGRQTMLRSQLVAVASGLTMNDKATGTPAATNTDNASAQGNQGTPQSYETVCLGGTFDYLHPGHKLLLTAGTLLLRIPEHGATRRSSRFIVGITGDALLKNKKFAEYVQAWDERASAVVDFVSSLLELRDEGWGETWGRTGPVRSVTRREPGRMEAEFREGRVKLECVEIQDAFGPTITDERVESLVVSGETRAGGQAVNDRRKGLGWKELEVYEVDVLDAQEAFDEVEPRNRQDYSSKISSTALRQRRADTAAAKG
ncbi:cytidylyltransferase [Sodiomyces alkalinus F11]|uniref:Cytidylyltransferase n=1 Tax=Sodiomyces alkalinus (strain CBS 110278 / VKM F-3762 / F11) TaxID=1314773 RepID=A0A3N2PR52_SODAK|nr:cytidylyltransferase [Sodiomyces alkalinus F11]ROT36983.1 cytidylyltransferase [Sodiomyces alkalinus F11]